ncbi:BTAD domain-containing putative transcriptional regulator [Salsipaludibacter albus]|uniref:nSTAND1 domain-containing NTPase n=1 Tax=Salsipaludibacter albus TaxID=2849650 RepID=UPI001EE4808B|nr:BTAD domain-containing putative transcriptional regulator [Salsipaludibacter albus]MBY5163589.1 winged helix-turn-helix domain-containing protein [Salsipaludibacter albus]
MLAYRVLGALEVLDEGEGLHVGGARQRRLLAMLLVHRNETVSTDRLAEAVFAGDPTPAADTTLRSYVARLRRVLRDHVDQSVLDTRAPGYVLWVGDDSIDAGVFEQLVTEGRALRAADDPIGAAAALRQAMGAWGGDPYPEFADEGWVRPEVQRLDRLRLAAEEHLLDAELECGLDAELVARLETLVARDPLAESFRSKLMVALYRSGRQVDALGVMHEYREVLADGVGLDPSPELVELEHQILVHDQDLQRPAPPGRVLRGYHLGERLGTGRDGTVHAARLPGVDRDLAIRIVPSELADRPDVVRSFDATMRRVAALHHEAVVPIHDHWREPGAAYVVMRRMEGGSLRDRLEHGPLSVAEAAALARRVGLALMAAHERGVVHGRLVPESVLLDGAGTPYLSDFPLGDVDHASDDDARALVALVLRALTGEPGVGGPRTGTAALLEELRALASEPSRPSLDVVVPMLVDRLDRAAGRAPDGEAARRVNPYKGLRAFDESDAADFFGRGDLVEDLVQRLAGHGLAARLALLVGASGSGKSSVVRAGLLPRVRAGAVPHSQDWLVTTITPGAQPFKELGQGLARVATASASGRDRRTTADLADELARDGLGIDTTLRRILPDEGQLLLVVDQFEELFTLAGEDEQRQFLDGLVHALETPDSRLRLVTTLRADFYDRPLRFHRFGAMVREATVTVPAMQAADLEATIVGPARRAGLDVEAPLVAELVAAVIDQPAAMPALQFTLYELAQRAGGAGLTLAGYREIGGVGGAIATRAEGLYRSLDDDRVEVRHLFEHLVVIGTEGEPTRRRTPRSELAALVRGRPVDEVVEPWAQARLLTHDRHPQTREPTVEVAHEALVREWPRLRDWIEEGRGAIVASGQLRMAAAEWEALQRDPGALYRGSRLDGALAQLTGSEDRLPAEAREFLAASRAARHEEQHREADRVARQARTNRRLRLQLGGLAVALVVALVGGWLALDQRQRAQGEERTAVARELAAASVATLDEDPELSILLALAGLDHTRAVDGTVVPEAHSALHEAVTSSRAVLSVPDLGGPVDWSADGSTFVTEGPEETGLVDIRDAETGESVLAFTGHDVDINDVVFSADGALVATAGDDGAAKVWDVDTGQQVASFSYDGVVLGLSFDPDGSLLAASWRDEGLVRVHDLERQELVSEVELDASGTSFGPEGRLVIAAGRQAVVVDTTTGQRLLEVTHPRDVPNPLGFTPVTAVAWSPDGRWIATGGTDRVARVWNADTGELRAALSGHGGGIVDLDWAHDSVHLASGSEDGSARVWAVADGGGTELVRVAARETQGIVTGVAFSPNGDRLLTGDGGIRAARIWDVSTSGGAEHRNLPGSPNIPGAVDVGPDGRTLVATGEGVAGIVWDLATGEQRATLGPQDPDATDRESWEIDLSPDGELVATAPFAGPVRVWDVLSGDEVFTGDESVYMADAAWTADGRLLAATGSTRDAGWTTIFDRSGAVVARIDEEPGFTPIGVDFDPEGDRLVTTRRPIGRLLTTVDGLVVRDVATGAIVQRMAVPSGGAMFDPTGDRLVADELGAAAVWDPETGEVLARLEGHTGQVTDAVFHPRGHTVATASLDGTIRLWSSETGAPTLALRGHGGPAGGVAFGPDGDLLASSGEGEIRVWTLDLDELVAIATSRLTRGFTDVECRQFLHVEQCPDEATDPRPSPAASTAT